MPQIVKNYIPSGKAYKSQGVIQNQGITYDEVNTTYNDSRYQYGGLYGSTDMVPQISLAKNIFPNLFVTQVKAFLDDQGITYDQLGVSYNDILYQYGGVYGFEDIKPLISLAKTILPRIVGYADIYTKFVPVVNPNTNISIGPGFFMFITH